MACLGALGNERNYKSILIYYNIYLPAAPAQQGLWHPPQGKLAELPASPASPSFPEESLSTLCPGVRLLLHSHLLSLLVLPGVLLFPAIVGMDVPSLKSPVSMPANSRIIQVMRRNIQTSGSGLFFLFNVT